MGRWPSTSGMIGESRSRIKLLPYYQSVLQLYRSRWDCWLAICHTKEPLLALLLTNVSKHDSKVIGEVTLGVQSYYLYRYCWNCRKNRFTDKEWEQKTAEELMCFNMWGIPYRLPLYCSSKCSDEHNERLRAHIRIVPHHLIGAIGEC